MSLLIDLTLASTVFALVLLLAISFGNWKMPTTPKLSELQNETSEKVYEDEDGVATPETQQAYSVQFQKRSILLLTIITLSLSTALAIIGTVTNDTTTRLARRWMTVAIWVRTAVFSPPGQTLIYHLATIFGKCHLSVEKTRSSSDLWSRTAPRNSRDTVLSRIVPAAAHTICALSRCFYRSRMS